MYHMLICGTSTPDMVVDSCRWSWEVQILSLKSVENYLLPHSSPFNKKTPDDKASDTSEEKLC
jgi:hypothetical protein